MRFLSASEPTVQSAEAICRSENVDRRMETELLFRDSIPATVIVDLSLDGWGPFKLFPQWVKIALRVECEKGSVEIWNYPLPSLWHSITVKTQDGRRRVEKVYKPTQGKGEEWWSAYVLSYRIRRGHGDLYTQVSLSIGIVCGQAPRA